MDVWPLGPQSDNRRLSLCARQRKSGQFRRLRSTFTWLGHRPLLAQEGFAGLGRLPHTGHVGGKHAELIEATALQVAHLRKDVRHRKKKKQIPAIKNTKTKCKFAV